MSKTVFDIIYSMNNRDYKNFVAGEIYHIYNRGNNKEKIFFDEQDFRAFLFRLGLGLGFTEKELNTEKLIAMPYSRIRITDVNVNNYVLHSFCLMPNHFHLLIEQIGDKTISKLISKICTSYSKYINKKHGRIGHTFQDKFKSVRIEDNEQLMWIFEYIHTNPVKDNLVNLPSEYTWSSYNDFANNRDLLIVNKKFTNLVDVKDRL